MTIRGAPDYSYLGIPPLEDKAEARPLTATELAARERAHAEVKRTQDAKASLADISGLLGQMMVHYQRARDLEKQARDTWGKLAASFEVVIRRDVRTADLDHALLQCGCDSLLARQIVAEYRKMRGDQ